MSDQDIKSVAEGLSEAQRIFILQGDLHDRELPEIEWPRVPDELFVQFTPDLFCSETGCYLGGGRRHFFAGSLTSCPNGTWQMMVELTPLGLAVRTYLQEQSNDTN